MTSQSVRHFVGFDLSRLHQLDETAEDGFGDGEADGVAIGIEETDAALDGADAVDVVGVDDVLAPQADEVVFDLWGDTMKWMSAE